MSISQRTLYRWEEKILRKLDIRMFETPVPTRKYRELLPQCEAFFMSIPRGQFISRMIFEAMACKTLCIFEIQSKRHERELESLGFINGEHYIGIDKIKNLQWIYDSCGIKKRKEIVENAYNVVINNHTYKNRAEFILEIYNDIKNER